MIKIISRLWSSIYDLLLLVKGQGNKTLEQIEQDLDVLEMLCRPYAGVDESEDIFLGEEVKAYEHKRVRREWRKCPADCPHADTGCSH